MLFPTSIVAIKRDGLSKKGERIRALNSPRFFISSRCNLLDATKAISMPEKKAENKSEKSIIRRLLSGSIKVF